MRETDVLGVEVIGFDHAILEVTDAIGSRGVELIKTVRAVDDEGGFGTEFVEDVRKRLGKFGVEDASELNVCARGIGEWTKDVEDGALTDFFAWTNGVFHGGMKFGREHKSDANLLDGLRDLFGGEVEIDAEGGEDIGATAL